MNFDFQFKKKEEKKKSKLPKVLKMSEMDNAKRISEKFQEIKSPNTSSRNFKVVLWNLKTTIFLALLIVVVSWRNSGPRRTAAGLRQPSSTLSQRVTAWKIRSAHHPQTSENSFKKYVSKKKKPERILRHNSQYQERPVAAPLDPRQGGITPSDLKGPAADGHQWNFWIIFCDYFCLFYFKKRPINCIKVK